MGGNTFGERRRHDSSDLFDAGRPQLRDASEAAQKFLRSARAYARNVFHAGLNRALGPALAMESYREAVCLVANLLDQMKDR